MGVLYNNDKNIGKENIPEASRPVITYNGGISTIYTIAVHENFNFLLAGEDSLDQGRLLQYRLDTGALVRDYGSLGISCVFSSARLGRLCFFGGYNSQSFAVVDVVEQKVVYGPVRSAITTIFSLAVCKTSHDNSGAKTVLAVAGENINYSNDRTDLFDVTGLVSKTSAEIIKFAKVGPFLWEHKECSRKAYSNILGGLKSRSRIW